MVGNAIGLCKDKQDDDDRDGFYSLLRRVFSLVFPNLTWDSEINVTVEVLLDIRGPQPGKSMADRM
jgi:hypothetical protein